MKTLVDISSDKKEPPGNDSRPLTHAQTYITYVIQPQDTLNRLAKKFHTSRQTLLALNHLTEPVSLQSGQTLRIPEIFEENIF